VAAVEEPDQSVGDDFHGPAVPEPVLRVLASKTCLAHRKNGFSDGAICGDTALVKAVHSARLAAKAFEG